MPRVCVPLAEGVEEIEAGTALPFALHLAGELKGAAVAEKLRAAMLVPHPG